MTAFPRDPWWHILGLLSGLLFAVMLFVARLHLHAFDSLDSAVAQLVLPLQTLRGVELFLAITTLGNTVSIALIALAAAYVFRTRYSSVLRLFLVLVFATVSVQLAKAFVERVRPEVLDWLSPLPSFSFPSGHAALATALYGTIAVLAYRRIQHPFMRVCVAGLFILILALVSFSRIVLSAHYASDVLAGMLLGAFWISMVFMLPHRRL